jgi:hypothetical protein
LVISQLAELPDQLRERDRDQVLRVEDPGSQEWQVNPDLEPSAPRAGRVGHDGRQGAILDLGSDALRTRQGRTLAA